MGLARVAGATAAACYAAASFWTPVALAQEEVGDADAMNVGMMIGSVVLILAQVAIVMTAIVWFRRSQRGSDASDDEDD